MPVRKVKGGYQWGSSGKVYRSRSSAEKQGYAIEQSMKKNCKKHGTKNCLDYSCCGGSYGKKK